MLPPAIKLSHAGTAAVVLFILFAAVYVSTYLSQQPVLVSLVETWGYVAVIIVGLVSGLNAIIPIPAATFTPIFTAAGLDFVGIVTALVIGTVLADFIGFLFGSSTKGLVANKYPTLVSFLDELVSSRRVWIVPFVIFYAAFVPFPNEAVLIPLAFAGVKFERLLIPLCIGNGINQLLLVSGVDQLSRLFV